MLICLGIFSATVSIEPAYGKGKKKKIVVQHQDGKYSLDFENAEIMDVIKAISKMTSKNFIVSSKIRSGKITIISPSKVSADEAYLAFLSTLEANDMTIVRSGKYFKVVPLRSSKQDNIPTFVGKDQMPKPEDRMVTRLHRLKHITADTVNQTLRQLVSRDGEIVPYLPTNTLIISDTASNLLRILKILGKLDVPGGQDQLWIVPINYSTAQDVADKITQIFEQGKGPKARKKSGQGGIDISISKIIPDDRTNKLIIMANRQSLKKIQKLINALDIPIPGEGKMHVLGLQNAAAETLAASLQTIISGAGRKGGKGGGGGNSLFRGEVKVNAEKSTNSLVIVASQKDFRSLKQVIKKLDKPRRQVYVEAVIMEISVKKSRDLGMALNLGAAPTIQGQTVPIFGTTKLGPLNAIQIDPGTLTSLSGFLGGVRGPNVEGAGQAMGLGNINIPSFGAVMKALQRSDDVDVLSTPHILTTDNQKAEITVGENIPFQSGFTSGGGAGGSSFSSFSPVVSVQRQDVALTLKIKPQINAGDYVKLDIKQEVSEVKSLDPLLGPTTSKRMAKTVVVVRDQQTVVIGGLMKDKLSENVQKIPFFGDIPLLGWFFRSTGTIKDKSNLLIFLTPYIIKDQTDFRKIYERKMGERKEFVKKFYGTAAGYEAPIDYTRKIGPLQQIYNSIQEEEQAIKDGKTTAGDRLIRGGERKIEEVFTSEEKSSKKEPAQDNNQKKPVTPEVESAVEEE